MKVTSYIQIALASIAVAADEAKPLSDVAKVSTAVEVVFVTEGYPKGYVPDGPPITVDNDLRELLKRLESIEMGGMAAPFVGYLGHVALKDKSGKVLGILGVINFYNTFSFVDAEIQDGKIVRAKDGIYLEGISPEFSRWMYDNIKRQWPERIKNLQESYKKVGKWSLEELLFGRKDGQQPGAGQPATKPADRAPVKDQPSTPTSTDAPR